MGAGGGGGVPWSKVTATRYLEPQVRAGPQVGTNPDPTEHDTFPNQRCQPSLNASSCVSFMRFTFTGLAVLCRHLEPLATGAVVATAGQVRAVLFAPTVLRRTVHDHLGTFVWNIRKTWECVCLKIEIWFLWTNHTDTKRSWYTQQAHTRLHLHTHTYFCMTSKLHHASTDWMKTEREALDELPGSKHEWTVKLSEQKQNKKKQYQYFMIDWANSQKAWMQIVTYGTHSHQRHRHSPAHCCRLWTQVRTFCWHTWTAQRHRCWSGCS